MSYDALDDEYAEERYGEYEELRSNAVEQVAKRFPWLGQPGVTFNPEAREAEAVLRAMAALFEIPFDAFVAAVKEEVAQRREQ